jgi:hypothetical protein
MNKNTPTIADLQQGLVELQKRHDQEMADVKAAHVIQVADLQAEILKLKPKPVPDAKGSFQPRIKGRMGL